MIDNFINTMGYYDPIITEYISESGETFVFKSCNWGYIFGCITFVVLLIGLGRFIRGVIKHFE